MSRQTVEGAFAGVQPTAGGSFPKGTSTHAECAKKKSQPTHDVTERARLRHMLHKARIKCLEGGLLRKRLRAACRSQGMLGGEKIVAKTFTWRARYELLAVGLIEPTT